MKTTQIFGAIALVLCPNVLSAEPAPRFTERAAAAGLVHEYTGGWEHFVGGGVAVLDCNGDGFPELFAAGGTSPSVLLVNGSGEAGAAVEFDHGGEMPELTGVTGAWPLDFDSDGVLDLFVLRVGGNVLLQGQGGCAFVDVTGAWGLGGGDRWSTAFSATWDRNQDLPTLAVGNYVDRSDPDGPFGSCDGNTLYRPQAGAYSGTALDPGYCALSMLFSDWNRLGRQDLRISNDRHYYLKGGYEEMWQLGPELRRYDARDGWEKVSIWGMGIASRDLTGDGLPEIYLTSMGDQLLQFRQSGNNPVWKSAPYEQGATAHRPYQGDDGRPSTGWHAAFGDVDNDGDDDLFVAKGNVDQMPENAMADPNNLLLSQTDGRFTEAGGAAGLASPHRGRGAALADLNLDGLLDVVVVNRRAPMEIYQNVTEDAGNWLSVEPVREGVNTRLVGGWIELRDRDWFRAREITVGGGHGGGQAGPEHFGLGLRESVEMRLILPDGRAGPWRRVAAGQALGLGLEDGLPVPLPADLASVDG